MRMSLSCEELWEEAKTPTKAKVWRWKSKSCASLSFAYVLITQSCLTLCDLVDCSLPGSSVQGILQVRILEWVTIPFSRGSSWPRDWTRVSCIAGGFFTVWATRKLYFPLPISKSSPSSRTHIEPPSSWSPPDTSFPVDPSLHPRALKPGMPIWLEQLG